MADKDYNVKINGDKISKCMKIIRVALEEMKHETPSAWDTFYAFLFAYFGITNAMQKSGIPREAIITFQDFVKKEFTTGAWRLDANIFTKEFTN